MHIKANEKINLEIQMAHIYMLTMFHSTTFQVVVLWYFHFLVAEGLREGMLAEEAEA